MRDMNRNPRGTAPAMSTRKHMASGGGDMQRAEFGCEPLGTGCIPARGSDHATLSERERAIPPQQAGGQQAMPRHGKG